LGWPVRVPEHGERVTVAATREGAMTDAAAPAAAPAPAEAIDASI
jgi:hypothetical protein